MDLRPREERDFSEFYNNLDENSPLEVFVLKSTGSDAPRHAVNGPSRPVNNTTKLYIVNTVLRDAQALTANKEKAKVEKPKSLHKAFLAYGYRPTVRPKGHASKQYTRFHPLVASHPLLTYDMDEQDALYIEHVNMGVGTVQITPEVFEIAMSTLEYEWHKLELQMTAIAGPGLDGRSDLEMGANFEKYGSDDGTGGVDSLSEQRCAICNDLECDSANSIVYCDGCNIAVHQECYGVAFIPEGQWFCRRCMVNRGLAVTCAFCPSKTGAFKQLDNGMWSHVVCALWIREVYFANPVYLEPIEGVAAIPRNRWALVCCICKQKTGACIQCANRKCTQAYHVTCAKRAGLYMAMEKGVQGAVASNDTLKSYCDRHSPGHWDKKEAALGIQRTRMFYRDAHSLSRKNDRLESERRQANRVNRFKWKTENGTPIAPQAFAEKIYEILKLLRIGEVVTGRMLRGLGNESASAAATQQDKLRPLCAALCRYWCLKREAKGGAPLVRMRASDEEHMAVDEPWVGGDAEAHKSIRHESEIRVENVAKKSASEGAGVSCLDAGARQKAQVENEGPGDNEGHALAQTPEGGEVHLQLQQSGGGADRGATRWGQGGNPAGDGERASASHTESHTESHARSGVQEQPPSRAESRAESRADSGMRLTTAGCDPNASHSFPENDDFGTQMAAKIQFGRELDVDLQKIIDMNAMAIERQRLVAAQTDEMFKIADSAYFPFQTIGSHVMQNMRRSLQNPRGGAKPADTEVDVCAFEDIASLILDGACWSALDIDDKLQRIFAQRSYKSTAAGVTAARMLRHWNLAGMQELRSVENSQDRAIPFTDVEGLSFTLKQHDPKTVLEAEALSEAEEDPFAEPRNREALRSFMSK